MNDQEFWDTVFLRNLELVAPHEGATEEVRRHRIEHAREIADYAEDQRRESRNANIRRRDDT